MLPFAVFQVKFTKNNIKKGQRSEKGDCDLMDFV